MEGAFLQKVHDHYKNQDLSQYCFIFPTRRAAYVFRQKFLQTSGTTTWLPEILAIHDLVEKLTPYPIADDLILLLLLHEVASQYNSELTLEEFFPWGKILLNDFNEIDQNLINAEMLYRHSYEEREIDSRFSLKDNDLDDVAGFWKLFSNKPLSTLQEHFLANWKAMPEIYDQFKKKLIEKKIVYEGLAYRLIVEALNENTLFIPWKKLVFSGFYALSVAERSILEKLDDRQMVDIFWDVDSFYFDNEWHEAGLYLRRNDFLKKEFSWKTNYFKEQPKSIHITGAPLKTAQVKWLSNVLKEKILDPSFDPATSVIVLPDETMLLSLLYSLPEELKGLNITMGYPVKQSYVGCLANAFIQLHKNAKLTVDKYNFRRDDVSIFLSLLDPSLMSFRSVNHLISSNSPIYISSEKLIVHASLPAFAFVRITDLPVLKNSFIQLLSLYKLQIPESDLLNNIISEYIQNSLIELFASLEKQTVKLSISMALQIMEEALLTIKVPFTGEPIKGIQIMGFLETRTLDFDHVFILSVNENFLPASSSGKTYIPYSIRKLFKLPLRTEQDAVYAYHFYRLLQRAKEVHLIYNTEANILSGGEMSRYLLQIAFELNESKDYPVKLFFNQVNTEAKFYSESIIDISKDDSLIRRLKELYIKKEENKGFSATALADYVTCKLRFYFKYIAKIRKPDEPDKELGGRTFGNIFHASMKMLYQDKLELHPPDFKELKKRIKEVLDDAIMQEYKQSITTGNDLLLQGVLMDLLFMVTALDTLDAPLEIIGLEQFYAGSIAVDGIGEVAISGTIDRIDRQGEYTRIIDYKTGKDEISAKTDIKALFSNPDKKAMLQLMFYTLLYKVNSPEAAVKAGIYKLRKMNAGIQWMDQGSIITNEMLGEFRKELQRVITEIFDPSISFSQTQDEKRCEFCDYNKICNRL